MIKKLAYALVALVVIIAVGGFLFFSSLDGLIKTAVEKYGSEAVQADVSLDSVKLTLASGEGELKGLSVGNPKGFSTPKAFTLGDIQIQVETNSIKGTGPIVISNMTITQPQVTYELLNDGSSNLNAIEANTTAYANSFKGAAAPPQQPAATPKEKAEGRKLIINNLTITSGQVSISQQMLGGKQLSAPLPTIHLTNIGKASGGATAAEVAEQVLNAISNAAATSAVSELAKDKISGLIKEVPGSAIGGAAVDTAGKKLKGIFGN